MGGEEEWRDVGGRSAPRAPAARAPPGAGTAGADAGAAGWGPRGGGRGRGGAQRGRHGSSGAAPGRGGGRVPQHSHSQPPSDSHSHSRSGGNAPSGHAASEQVVNGPGPRSAGRGRAQRGRGYEGGGVVGQMEAFPGAPEASQGTPGPGPGWQAQGQRGPGSGRGGGPGARHPSAQSRHDAHQGPGRGHWGSGAPGMPQPGVPRGVPGVPPSQQRSNGAGAGFSPPDPGAKPRAPVFITDLSQLAQHFPSLLSDSSDEDEDEDVEGAEEGTGVDGRGPVAGEGRAPKQRQRASASELESSIFRAHQQEGAGPLGSEAEGGASFGAGLEKIREHLNALQSGGATCLICLERIKGSDPVWSCRRACHSVLHLLCIQSWARQAGPPSTQPGPLPGQAGAPASQPGTSARPPWQCPMCRTDYEGGGIPREYLCFCGKVLDPPFDPWITPHSCGELCGRALGSQCHHKCTLLCHPGPCPPCPQLVEASCFCGRQSDLRRCAGQRFSCGAVCGRLLPCGAHPCEAGCHEGACPPCAHESSFPCACGRVSQWRRCAERSFSCGEVCARPLPCGRHKCEVECHSGVCPGCPLFGRRLCPCGKKGYEGLPCDQPALPCGATCEKPLACGRHRCADRCHTGDCSSVCRLVILKHCACGSTKKEVPCHQEVHCERRCQRGRNCGRHLCKRRCCTGDCPPCSEVCNKKLRCGNHKCPAPCHSGPCAPCPVTVRIACCCGSTFFSVPCGAEKQQRPPKCAVPCATPAACRHRGKQKPHRCHYGPCPPCDLVCHETLSCGHACPVICHGPRPPPHPDYTLRPTKKARKGAPEAPPAEVACPPCGAPMVRPCRGRHAGQERTLPCSQDPEFSCALPCGNPLGCGNHQCQHVCHVVTVPRLAGGLPAPAHRGGAALEGGSSHEARRKEALTREGGAEGQKGRSSSPLRNGDGVGSAQLVGSGGGGQVPEAREEEWQKAEGEGEVEGLGEYLEEEAEEREEEEEEDTCEVCVLMCAKPRDPPCAHPCSERCHPGACVPCKELVKKACHCGTMSHVLECAEWGAATDSQRLKLLACGGPCHRKLPFCSHLCPQICHPGPCPAPKNCRKKVTVRCSCMRLKKEWLCCDVQVAERKAAAKEGAPAASATTKRVTVTGVGLIPCDSECHRLEAERRRAAAEEERRRKEEAEAEAARAAAELAKGGLRRRRRGRGGSVEDDLRRPFLAIPESVVWVAKTVCLVVLVVAVLAALVVWLMRLSDYMNQRDARRPRARFRY